MEQLYYDVTRHLRDSEKNYDLYDWMFLELAPNAQELENVLRFHFQKKVFLNHFQDFLLPELASLVFDYLDGYDLCLTWLKNQLISFLESKVLKKSKEAISIRVLKKTIGRYDVETINMMINHVYLLGTYYDMRLNQTFDFNPFFEKYTLDERSIECDISSLLIYRKRDSEPYSYVIGNDK